MLLHNIIFIIQFVIINLHEFHNLPYNIHPAQNLLMTGDGTQLVIISHSNNCWESQI